MNGANRGGMSWTARLLVALLLVLIGAAAAVWALAHYQQAARVLGVTPAPAAQVGPHPEQTAVMQTQPTQASAQSPQGLSNTALEEQILNLQSQLQQVESQSQQAQGSAGRADALLVAFAARRAIERGVALGYLEPLLVNRFGADHPQAVATVVTASRSPVRLTDLITEYQSLEPVLTGPAVDQGWWSGIKRGLGSIITIHRADQPSTLPQARYQAALTDLTAGEADAALAETMRLPGAPKAGDWINKARQYVAAHRALDEIETAALIGKSAQG
jgi:hypothetical protein